jgi:hypothetical protein
MVSVTMPSGAVHAMTYTPRDEMDAYVPPASGAFDLSYDADRGWSGHTLAGGRGLAATYDGGGRPSGRSDDETSVEFAYAGVIERMTSMSWVPVSGTAQNNSATWDAQLPLTGTSSGAASGQYAFGYDSRMLLASMNLTRGADTANIALARDRDGLVTGYGPFSVSRLGPAGAPSAISDANSRTRMTRRGGWRSAGRSWRASPCISSI